MSLQTILSEDNKEIISLDTREFECLFYIRHNENNELEAVDTTESISFGAKTLVLVDTNTWRVRN